MGASPSHSISRILVFTLSLNLMLFMGALNNIRIQMTNENQSAFEVNGNGMVLDIAIVALFAVEVTYGILFLTKMRNNHYTTLKFIAIFSAYLASFLLLAVLNPSHTYNLSFVGFAMMVACVSSGDDDYDRNLDKSSSIAIFTYLGLVLVPIVLVLVLFVPKNLDWIVYSVIYPSAVMEAIFFLIIFLKFITEKNRKAQNLEAQQVIPQDKNNDLEAQPLAQQDENNMS